MAIEIRELHIRAAVGTEPDGERQDARERRLGEEEREQLVSLCVERVMEILARRKER